MQLHFIDYPVHVVLCSRQEDLDDSIALGAECSTEVTEDVLIGPHEIIMEKFGHYLGNMVMV